LQIVTLHSKQRGRAVIASLLTGLVLLLDAMVVCPSFHELIHADAGKAGHECAVTMFAHGQVDSATVDIVFAAPHTFVPSLSFAEISVFSPAIENLPAGRAPPVSSSNS
jgi:hypothetical protein